MSRTRWSVAKSEAVGERGMVAGKHPLATSVGLEVLQRGGNAVDAAVTMAFALAVVEPQSSGLGGGGFLVLHDASAGRNAVVDYAMDAPGRAAPDAYTLEDGIGASAYGWRKVRDDANVTGYRAVSVPGMVRGLALALERYGTISLREALAPAIRFADEGVEVLWQISLRIAMSMPTLMRFPASAAVFLPGGFPPKPWGSALPADRLRQPDLARTLRAIAEEGPDVFYEGFVARSIVAAMREHDGLIEADDLAAYAPTLVEDGLVSEYRDYQVVGVPGASGSITLQQALRILDGYDVSAPGMGTAETLHLHAEAFRLAFADRFRFVADPKSVAVPWAGLLSRDYASERRASIDAARATVHVEPGDPWRFETMAAGTGPRGGVIREGTSASSTTHLSVVDRDRRVVSLTQTLVNPFGCGAVAPGTGVLLNNAMSWFDPEPGNPNSAAPGKRGLNNMAPTIVLRDGRPFLTVGAAGGRKIIQAVAQVITNAIDRGMGVSDAVAAPRIDCSGPAVQVDSRFPDRVASELAAMGHNVQVLEESVHAYHFATPLGISIDPATGLLHGGADPFRLSEAVGY